MPDPNEDAIGHGRFFWPCAAIFCVGFGTFTFAVYGPKNPPVAAPPANPAALCASFCGDDGIQRFAQLPRLECLCGDPK